MIGSVTCFCVIGCPSIDPHAVQPPSPQDTLWKTMADRILGGGKCGESQGTCSSLAGGSEVRLHWTRWRPMEGSGAEVRRVLFHHGWTSNALAFTDIARAVAATGLFDCVVYSARGTGLSSRPDSEDAFDMDFYQADIVAIADFHWGSDAQFMYDLLMIACFFLFFLFFLPVMLAIQWED